MAKIIGHGAPTNKTFGVLGQEYFDKDSNKVYTCTKVTHKTAYRAGEADAEYEWSVIGNDPFEAKKEIITIVPEQSVTSEYSQDTPVGTVCMNRFPKTMDLIDGAKYIVCINNKNYEVTAKEVMGLVVIGDPFLYGAPVDSTGEPFFFMVMHEDPTQYVFVWKAEFGTTVTTSVICEREIFEKIDYKFMPEGYPKVEKKMVEIVPEQSVKGAINTGLQGDKWLDYSAVLNDLTIKENAEYKIVINGKEYFGKGQKVTIAAAGGETGIAIGSMDYLKNSEETPLDNFEPNFAISTCSGMTMASWGTSLGKTITLSISTEQEVVTPLAPKFVGAVFYQQDEYDIYLYKDAEFTEKVTKAELDKVSSSLVKVCFDNKMITVQNIEDCGDYSRVMFAVWQSANNYYWKFLNSAEYVQEIG